MVAMGCNPRYPYNKCFMLQQSISTVNIIFLIIHRWKTETKIIRTKENVDQELGAVKGSEHSSFAKRVSIALLEQNWCCEVIK